MAASRISELSDEMNKIKKEIRKNGRSLITEAFKDFFDSYHEVAQVKWYQYTPSFNDGDPCTFRVNDFNFITVEDLDSEDYDSSTYLHESSEISDKVMSKAINKDLQKIYKLLDANDMLELMLGDNLEVTVSRQGIDTEDYDPY